MSGFLGWWEQFTKFPSRNKFKDSQINGFDKQANAWKLNQLISTKKLEIERLQQE